MPLAKWVGEFGTKRSPLIWRYEMLVKWHPTRLNREIHSLLNSVWGDTGNGGMAFNPRVDIDEHEDRFELHADLPGVNKDEISVTVEKDTLTVKGERSRATQDKTDNVRRSERSYGKFSRSFRLGSQIDSEKITANYRDGVVTLNVPKAETTRARTIEVEVA